MAVNIKGTFKKDDKPNNGLEAISKELSGRPHERRIAIVIVRPARTVIDHADGTVTPTVQIDNIEALTGDDAKSAWELLANAYESRTGNPMPPQSLFDGPGTGDTLEGQDALPGMTTDDA